MSGTGLDQDVHISRLSGPSQSLSLQKWTLDRKCPCTNDASSPKPENIAEFDPLPEVEFGHLESVSAQALNFGKESDFEADVPLPVTATVTRDAGLVFLLATLVRVTLKERGRVFSFGMRCVSVETKVNV